MRIVNQYRTAMERQVGEAVAILDATRKGYQLMNSKSEFNRCSLPRIYVGDKKKIIEEDKEEELEEKRVKEIIRAMKSKRKKPLEKEIEVKDVADLGKECENIEKENREKWKRRRIDEKLEKEKRDMKENEDWERGKRVRKAEMKKSDYMKNREKDENERKRIEVDRKKKASEKKKMWIEYNDEKCVTKDENEIGDDEKNSESDENEIKLNVKIRQPVLKVYKVRIDDEKIEKDDEKVNENCKDENIVKSYDNEKKEVEVNDEKINEKNEIKVKIVKEVEAVLCTRKPQKVAPETSNKPLKRTQKFPKKSVMGSKVQGGMDKWLIRQGASDKSEINERTASFGFSP